MSPSRAPAPRRKAAGAPSCICVNGPEPTCPSPICNPPGGRQGPGVLSPTAARRKSRAYYEAAAFLQRAIDEGLLLGRMSKRYAPAEQAAVVDTVRSVVMPTLRAKAESLQSDSRGGGRQR